MRVHYYNTHIKTRRQIFPKAFYSIEYDDDDDDDVDNDDGDDNDDVDDTNV